MTFDVEKIVRRRKSVRAYENRPLSWADRQAINALILELGGENAPFPARIKMRLLEAKAGTDTEKLGTYGVIRGASTFIGVAVKNEDAAMEAMGYTFEKLVLAATAMGLGTCWLAGTFNREQFGNAMDRQPWRVVRRGSAFHFYREANPKGKYPYDLQRLDVGIGACHFHLAASERLLTGGFSRLSDPGISAPENMKYLFSWQMK